MHLELVELLKCPVAHRESVLVAIADQVESRFIVQGSLGCPECSAEYRIVDGVTHFHPPYSDWQHTQTSSQAEASVRLAPRESVQNLAEADAALRVAAQLGAREGHGSFALVNFAIGLAVALRAIVPARLLVVNPPDVAGAAALRTQSTVPAGIILCRDVPLQRAKLDGIAFATSNQIDGNKASVTTPIAFVDTLRGGGRMVARADEPVPDALRELVRDSNDWVAVREAVASSPVGLQRRAR